MKNDDGCIFGLRSLQLQKSLTQRSYQAEIPTGIQRAFSNLECDSYPNGPESNRSVRDRSRSRFAEFEHRDGTLIFRCRNRGISSSLEWKQRASLPRSTGREVLRIVRK